MNPALTDAALDYLLECAGMNLTDEEKAKLKSMNEQLAILKARVRQPRPITAELASNFGFTAEDLA
jgi:hypothetical protein